MSARSEQFSHRLETVAAATEAALMELLTHGRPPHEATPPERLLSAMRYVALGGKRVRPFLVVESAALFGVTGKQALPVGVAFECVHCYSLAHDDLPAMDDDDLRRGRPTAHIAYDEATAILAGDALLTLAFEVLARAPIGADAESRVALVALLARASGIGGMAGGQMLDLEAEGRYNPDLQPLSLTTDEIERLQAMKTGALLSATCEAGAILGRAKESERKALGRYARALGLVFQITDDLLDTDVDAASLGKATLLSVLGAAGARKRIKELVAEAEAALAPFGDRANMLTACMRWIAERKN